MAKLPADELYPLIEALREPGKEVQLNRVLASLADADEVFAREFASLLLEAKRTSPDVAGEHARNLPDLAGKVTCKGQHWTGRATAEFGFCDLWFRAAGPPVMTLAVEMKLEAEYQTEQCRRYLTELEGPGHGLAGLVVVTGHSHEPLGREIRVNKRWLGEVRWSTLSKRGLEDIRFEPYHAVLRDGWRALVKKLGSDGDLGVGGVTADKFEAWAKGKASNCTTLLMDECAIPATAALDGLLPRDRPSSRMTAGKRDVHQRPGEVSLKFGVDRPDEERFRLTLRRADRWERDTRPKVRVWLFPPTRTDRNLYSTESALRAGFHPARIYGRANLGSTRDCPVHSFVTLF